MLGARRDYDWSAGLTAITVPVMLVFADVDSIFPAHMAQFFALLGPFTISCQRP